MLVLVWFILTFLVFVYPNKRLFQSFFYLKVILYDAKNDSKYHNVAPLETDIADEGVHLGTIFISRNWLTRQVNLKTNKPFFKKFSKLIFIKLPSE